MKMVFGIELALFPASTTPEHKHYNHDGGKQLVASLM